MIRLPEHHPSTYQRNIDNMHLYMTVKYVQGLNKMIYFKINERMSGLYKHRPKWHFQADWNHYILNLLFYLGSKHLYRLIVTDIVILDHTMNPFMARIRTSCTFIWVGFDNGIIKLNTNKLVEQKIAEKDSPRLSIYDKLSRCSLGQELNSHYHHPRWYNETLITQSHHWRHNCLTNRKVAHFHYIF